MLNISQHSVHRDIPKGKFRSFHHLAHRPQSKHVVRVMIVGFILGFILLFVPWTQNIRSNGEVTTLKPGQRPQTINSVIDGRIENWFIQEGDFVEKGDTLLHISEIKDSYFDPDLMDRYREQLDAERNSVLSYEQKVSAISNQLVALEETYQNKLEQTRMKLQQATRKAQSDSIDYENALVNFDIAQKRLKRYEQLHEDGLQSLTDLESRKMKLQKSQAELVSKENKLANARIEINRYRYEFRTLKAEFQDKIAKASSDKYSAETALYKAQQSVAKLRNQLANFERRTGFYYVTAPQSGYVTRVIQNGIGETLKSGDKIMSIMPRDYDLAIEMYVRPIDLPLVHKGNTVRIQFDGWPAIVFSGWPNTSIGTYGGKVYAIDNFISNNGKYRVLVQPDPNEAPWPDALRVGSGTSGIMLLKDVPLWYELWRQVNGFPPDFYKEAEKQKSNQKAGKK